MIDQHDLYAYMRKRGFPESMIKMITDLIDEYIKDEFGS